MNITHILLNYKLIWFLFSNCIFSIFSVSQDVASITLLWILAVSQFVNRWVQQFLKKMYHQIKFTYFGLKGKCIENKAEKKLHEVFGKSPTQYKRFCCSYSLCGSLDFLSVNSYLKQCILALGQSHFQHWVRIKVYKLILM